MRPGHEYRLRGGDELLVDVVLAQRAVGTVLAVKDQGKGLRVAHAEQHQRSEALRIDGHAARLDPLAGELLQYEPSHGLIAHAADQRRAEPEPCRTDRDVGWATADGLRERRDVLEAAADLLSVQIDAHAPDSDEIQLRSHGVEMACAPRLGCPAWRISVRRSLYERDTPR